MDITDKVTQLKNKLKTQGLQGLALDIDETLSDTNTHWIEHMFRFHMPKDKTKEEVVGKYKFVENVPEWQTQEAYEFMQKMLYSNEFNEAIPLIHDADRAVKEINNLIPIVAYITARPETVVDGTAKWLKKHGFPKAELITRTGDIGMDSFNKKKNEWKAGVLKALYPEIVGIVDDNSLLADELEKIKYEGILFLYGSQSKAFDGKDNVIVCLAWPDVLDAIRGKI